MSIIPQSQVVTQTTIAPTRPQSALHSPASHLRFWPVAIIGLALDLWSKHWAFAHIDPQVPKVVIPNVLRFQLSLNSGALFGMGKGFAPIFVGASVLALMFVIYLFIHSTPRHRSMHIALGLVLAGAIGNLYDRTFKEAYVWDSPITRQHQTGVLIRSTEHSVTIGDYPTGANPHVYPLSPNITHGYRPVVRDFIKFEMKAFGHEVWPWIFNIADALLVVGVVILLINFWFERRHEPA